MFGGGGSTRPVPRDGDREAGRSLQRTKSTWDTPQVWTGDTRCKK